VWQITRNNNSFSTPSLTYFLRTHIRSSVACFVNGTVKKVNWTKTEKQIHISVLEPLNGTPYRQKFFHRNGVPGRSGLLSPLQMHDFSWLHTQWCHWRREEGSIAPPGKLHVKTGHPISVYFIFSILFVFSRLFLFAFFGLFSDYLGFFKIGDY